MKKFTQFDGNVINLGRIYPDNSRHALIRLYQDEHGVFQMQFLAGSDLAYTFLPECTELLNILKTGIIGVPMKQIHEQLVKAGLILIP